MSAFVPGPGVTLASRDFLTGSRNALPCTARRPQQVTAPPQILAIKLPNFLSNPLGGNEPEVEAPPPAPTPAIEPPPAEPVISIGGTPVASTTPPGAKKNQGMFDDGIPKFYNPTTARAEFRATAKGQNATLYDNRVGEQPVTTNRRVNPNGTFRNMDPYTDDLLWARPGWSSEEAAVGVRAVLRNVLGNSHIFESEVAELDANIACVTDNGNIKEFVRAVGLSNAYRSRFFERCSNQRFVELNFLHFLGRPPHDQAEVSAHIQLVTEQGYSAEINSYVDSDEYDFLYGETRVPQPNFRGGHPFDNDMNKLAILKGGFATSDKAMQKAYFATGDSVRFTGESVRKGLPEAWLGENAAREAAGLAKEFNPDIFWNPQPLGIREAEIKWIARLGTWTKFYYKDSEIYKSITKPELNHSDEEVAEAEAILKYGTTMSKAYIGSKWAYDIAPIIEVTAPTNADNSNGRLGVRMAEITFPIPTSLKQNV